MGLFGRRTLTGQVDKSNLPRHVAVIMDGNGRWAQKRGLPRSAGHKAGAESFRRLGTYCKELGIDYLTVYAFSTENWKRPPEEIDGIMELLRRYLHECIETMERDGNRLRFLGDLGVLDEDLRELIRETNEISSRVTGFQANVCLNYGGRDELVHAARAFARECAAGERCAEELTEEAFARYLYSDGLPEPELLIRRAERSASAIISSGSARTANFTSATRFGRTLTSGSLTRRSLPISTASAGSAA